MARFCAAMLLALLGFPLIVPAIHVENDGKTASCCRREGKHHCGMRNSQPESGSVLREKCPYKSGTPGLPSFSNQTLLSPEQSYFSDAVRHPSVQAQIEACYRISFNRSRQKRGPPALNS